MKLSISILILFIAIAGSSQISIEKSSIDSGGAKVSNGGISIIYTLGETMIKENNVANIYLSEGFITPHFDFAVGVTDYSIINGVTVFPNPTVDIVNIHFAEKENYLISVLTIGGKLLSKLTTDKKVDLSINMKSYNDGIYLIVIKSLEHEHYKAFKVVKSN